MGQLRQSSKGFTLLEMMVVVAIIGILATLAATNFTRQRQKSTVEVQFSALRSAVDRAQSLAAIAGSRVGDAARLLADPSCGLQPAPGGIFVQIVPPNLVLPSRVAYNAAADTMTVFCENASFATLTNGQGTISSVTAPAFGFTSNGRLVVPNGAMTVFVQASMTSNPSGGQYGFRVLPSGVTCLSQIDNPALPCDEAAN